MKEGESSSTDRLDPFSSFSQFSLRQAANSSDRSSMERIIDLQLRVLFGG